MCSTDPLSRAPGVFERLPLSRAPGVFERLPLSRAPGVFERLPLSRAPFVPPVLWRRHARCRDRIWVEGGKGD